MTWIRVEGVGFSVPSFLSSFLPSFLASFVSPSFLPSLLPLFLPSFLLAFLPSFLAGFSFRSFLSFFLPFLLPFFLLPSFLPSFLSPSIPSFLHCLRMDPPSKKKKTKKKNRKNTPSQRKLDAGHPPQARRLLRTFLRQRHRARSSSEKASNCVHTGPEKTPPSSSNKPTSLLKAQGGSLFSGNSCTGQVVFGKRPSDADSNSAHQICRPQREAAGWVMNVDMKRLQCNHVHRHMAYFAAPHLRAIL